MTRPRCQEPGCGRFVAAETDRCARHPPAPSEPALREEIDALRYVLARLVDEVDDLDTLARHVPRVSSVAIQAARAMQQLGGNGVEQFAEALGAVLTEMDEVNEEPHHTHLPNEAVSS